MFEHILYSTLLSKSLSLETEICITPIKLIDRSKVSHSSLIFQKVFSNTIIVESFQRSKLDVLMYVLAK